MKVVLAIFALLCAATIVSSQTTVIDDFTVDQDPLQVNAGTTTASTTAQDAARIYGGERDTTLTLDPNSVGTCRVGLSSTTNVNIAGFLDANGDGQNDNPGDNGIFVAANDQSCFARTVVFYNGVGGAGFSGSLANLNNVASAFRIRYYSDLAGRQFLIRVNSGANACTTTLTTTGGQNVDDKTIPFGAFTTGCDFSNVRSFEIDIPAQSNFDVTISVFEFVATSLSGRVYVDCACDNTFNNNDQPISGVTVTARPGSNCPSGSADRTITTNGDGSYRFTGLSACTYTVSPAVTTFTPCTSPSQTGTTILGQETTNVNFPYRGTSSFDVPQNREVRCTESTQPSNTGTATTSSICDGGRTVTFTDTVTAGTCDARAVISRRWTDGVNSGTQTITVVDTEVGPSLVCPQSATVQCDSSLLPSVTGRPTVGDDCSRDIDVTYTGTDVDGQCDGQTCSRNKIVTRTFRAVDDCGNAAASTCTQTITIIACATAKTCPSPPNCHNGSIFYRDGVAQN